MGTLTLMRGTDTTDTVATDGVATTGLTATTDTMERGLLRLSQCQLLPLIPMLMLMPGTATMVTTERGLLRLNLQLSQLLLLTLKLMLMLGMDITDTGVTGAKPTNREVDSSSDCDFPSTLASIS